MYELTVEESTILVSLIALLASRGNFCSSPSKSISSTTSKDLGLPPRACGATPIRLLKSLEKKEKRCVMKSSYSLLPPITSYVKNVLWRHTY